MEGWAGWSGRRGLAGTDAGQPGLNVRFRVAAAQTVQPEKPLASGGLDGGVLDIGPPLDGIAQLLQLLPEGFHGVGAGDGGLNVLPDQCPESGPALGLRVPFRIVPAALSRLDHGKAVGAADFIGNAANIPVVVLKSILVLSPVHKGNGVEQDMTMQVVPV